MDYKDKEKRLLENEDLLSLPSMKSESDLYPKTNFTMTTINTIKSFVGIGILATPYGFRMVGYFIATILILLNGFLNSYTACLQAKTKEKYKMKIKNYTDLGKACYGSNG